MGVRFGEAADSPRASADYSNCDDCHSRLPSISKEMLRRASELIDAVGTSVCRGTFNGGET
jgi:hypothetical protein